LTIKINYPKQKSYNVSTNKEGWNRPQTTTKYKIGTRTFTLG